MSNSSYKTRKERLSCPDQQAAKVEPPEKNKLPTTQGLHIQNCKRPRGLKLDKSKKKIKKKSRKMDKKCSQHDSIILENSIKESFQVKTPYVILSNQRYKEIKLNVIMLINPQVEWVPKKSNDSLQN